jgi:hypothetical protein
MLCGTLPFDDDPNNENSADLVALYRYIMGSILTFHVPLSRNAINLVSSILHTNPKERATLKEIMEHKLLFLF